MRPLLNDGSLKDFCLVIIIRYELGGRGRRVGDLEREILLLYLKHSNTRYLIYLILLLSLILNLPINQKPSTSQPTLAIPLKPSTCP
jgi:hypothetical protein